MIENKINIKWFLFASFLLLVINSLFVFMNYNSSTKALYSDLKKRIGIG